MNLSKVKVDTKFCNNVGGFQGVAMPLLGFQSALIFRCQTHTFPLIPLRPEIMLLSGTTSPPDEPEVKLTQDQQNNRTALILQPISHRCCQRSDTFRGNDRGEALSLGFFSSPATTIGV